MCNIKRGSPTYWPACCFMSFVFTLLPLTGHDASQPGHTHIWTTPQLLPQPCALHSGSYPQACYTRSSHGDTEPTKFTLTAFKHQPLFSCLLTNIENKSATQLQLETEHKSRIQILIGRYNQDRTFRSSVLWLHSELSHTAQMTDIKLFTNGHLMLCKNYKPEPHHVTVIKTDGAGKESRCLSDRCMKDKLKAKLKNMSTITSESSQSFTAVE